MAQAFLVELDKDSGHTLPEGVTSLVVWANDAAQAQALAKAVYQGDSDAAWAAATVTALSAPADLNGWKFDIDIYAPGELNPMISVEQVGAAADTWDTIAAALAAKLNATSINAAAYDNVANTLTVAAAADGIGDHHVNARVYPPGCQDAMSILGAITQAGAAGAALTIAWPADATVIAKLFAKLRST